MDIDGVLRLLQAQICDADEGETKYLTAKYDQSDVVFKSLPAATSPYLISSMPILKP